MLFCAEKIYIFNDEKLYYIARNLKRNDNIIEMHFFQNWLNFAECNIESNTSRNTLDRKLYL